MEDHKIKSQRERRGGHHDLTGCCVRILDRAQQNDDQSGKADKRHEEHVRDFFVAEQGQFGSFTFVDPKDNTTYSDCSLMIDDFDFTLNGERRGRTSMMIRENRS